LGAIDDYNRHIGGADIVDQLLAGVSTQQRGVRPWKPLFHWLLDTRIINAFHLLKHQRKAALGTAKDNVRSAHRAFRIALVLELLKDPLPKAAKQVYITKNTVTCNPAYLAHRNSPLNFRNAVILCVVNRVVLLRKVELRKLLLNQKMYIKLQ
jgi:hypothetical protein